MTESGVAVEGAVYATVMRMCKQMGDTDGVLNLFNRAKRDPGCPAVTNEMCTLLIPTYAARGMWVEVCVLVKRMTVEVGKGGMDAAAVYGELARACDVSLQDAMLVR